MERDMQFLFEVSALRNIRRHWSRFLNIDFDNVAEHHFRVIWTALVIAGREKKGDTAKIIKMALVHDITESRTGDVDYISRQYVERKEELAIRDILKNTVLEKEFLEVWREYEERESIEAKIVKDADNLEIDFELRELAAKGNPSYKDLGKHRKYIRDTKFYTKTAKDLFDALPKSNPHDWHRKGRNRVNAGDWKK